MLPRARTAFTLIELIVALVIVGLLTAASLYGYHDVFSSAGEHSATTVLSGVDAAARQAASENGAGYVFPVIGENCVSGAAGAQTLAAAGVSVTSSASSGPRTVSACVDPATDTLFLAVQGTTGGCGFLTDTIIQSALPSSVTSTTTGTTGTSGTTTSGTSTAAGGSGAHYGLSTSTTSCSATALYAWVGAGHTLASTNPAAPTPVSI